jgi:hypothetical protein
MKTRTEILHIQISFCEAYLSRQHNGEPVENAEAVREYVLAQLALAKGLLAIEEKLLESERAIETLRQIGRVPSLPAHLAA